MPFDWSTVKQLAYELSLKDDEASKRSAISRLYYAIYHLSKKYLEGKNNGYLFSDNKPSHQQVWDEFIRIGNHSHRNIGENGRRLAKQRVKADYQEINRIDDELRTSFDIGKNILYNLDLVQKQ